MINDIKCFWENQDYRKSEFSFILFFEDVISEIAQHSFGESFFLIPLAYSNEWLTPYFWVSWQHVILSRILLRVGKMDTEQ